MRSVSWWCGGGGGGGLKVNAGSGPRVVSKERLDSAGLSWLLGGELRRNCGVELVVGHGDAMTTTTMTRRCPERRRPVALVGFAVLVCACRCCCLDEGESFSKNRSITTGLWYNGVQSRIGDAR